jgi:hypothetical protein
VRSCAQSSDGDERRYPRSNYGDIVPGMFTPVLAKHSKHFNLIHSLEIGVSEMQRNFESMTKQVAH